MKSSNNIYLDFNSTTPVDPEVMDYMMPFFSKNFANASSQTHFPGRHNADAVELARLQVATYLGAESSEIIFTSGATESINLAILGVCEFYKNKGRHIITWATEHKAVLDTCSHLEKTGYNVSILPVDREGLPDLDRFKNELSEKTILVIMMLANNETGVIMPVHEMAQIAHDNGSFVMCDATQAAGKMRLQVEETGADLLCISSHKIYGPKGTGILYIKRKNPRVKLAPIIFGGGHEGGLRPGTLNVPGIAGMGKACELISKRYWDDISELSKMRTTLEQMVTNNGIGYVNGSVRNRIPNTTNICFPGIKSSSLITALPEISMSTGSACTSAIPSPSHVLMAMGLSESEAYSSVRFSVGRINSYEEIITAGNLVRDVVLILKTKSEQRII